MKPGAMVAIALAGLSISTSAPPQQYSYVGQKCMTKGSGQLLALGGASLGSVADAEFADGSACTVIPPAGTPASISLRCVSGGGAAEILASVSVAATAPAGQWCVEVRTVDPAFVE